MNLGFFHSTFAKASVFASTFVKTTEDEKATTDRSADKPLGFDGAKSFLRLPETAIHDYIIHRTADSSIVCFGRGR